MDNGAGASGDRRMSGLDKNIRVEDQKLSLCSASFLEYDDKRCLAEGSDEPRW